MDIIRILGEFMQSQGSIVFMGTEGLAVMMQLIYIGMDGGNILTTGSLSSVVPSEEGSLHYADNEKAAANSRKSALLSSSSAPRIEAMHQLARGVGALVALNRWDALKEYICEVREKKRERDACIHTNKHTLIYTECSYLKVGSSNMFSL